MADSVLRTESSCVAACLWSFLWVQEGLRSNIIHALPSLQTLTTEQWEKAAWSLIDRLHLTKNCPLSVRITKSHKWIMIHSQSPKAESDLENRPRKDWVWRLPHQGFQSGGIGGGCSFYSLNSFGVSMIHSFDTLVAVACQS